MLVSPVPADSRRRGIISAAVAVIIAVASLTAGIIIIITATGGLALGATLAPGQRAVTASYGSQSRPLAAGHISSGARWYTVASGDTLSLISGREYGRPACWPGIYRRNVKVIGSDPDVINTGQRLAIPAACGTKPVAVSAPPAGNSGNPVITVQSDSGSIMQYVDEVFGSGASCAVEILDHESGTSWADVTIANPGTGAYGLPQALPGSKMASAGADWATDPVTQLRWMLGYVDASYGGVCAAASHDLSSGTY